MALVVLPYPSMDFVPLDILTADELDQIVANIDAINNATIDSTVISNNAITTPKVADGAITTPKLDDGAITTAKLDDDAVGMIYLGKASLTSASSSLSITLGTTYDNYKVAGCGVMASGSSTYIDLQMLDGSTPINNYHQVQRVINTTWSSEVAQDVSYANNVYSVNSSEGFTFEMDVFRAGTAWTKYSSFLGSGGGLAWHTAIANGRNVNATKPTGFKLATGGTFATGSWIKVWGWNN